MVVTKGLKRVQAIYSWQNVVDKIEEQFFSKDWAGISLPNCRPKMLIYAYANTFEVTFAH